MIEQINDYKALNTPPYLIEQFKGSTFQDFIEAFDRQFNELEQAAFDVLLNMWITTAVGEQLDVLGLLFDLDRLGRDDESYRTLIALAAKINTGSPTPELLIEAVKGVYGATTVNYIPDYPAKVIIEQDGSSGLFLLDDLETIGGTLIETIGGEQIQIRIPDTAAEGLVELTVPAGVGLTVTTI